MSISDKIQFTALLVTIITFAIAEGVRIRQRSKQDKRSDVKLRIFEILGGDSLTLEQITEKYRIAYGRAPEVELRKAIYEMLVDETAYYEFTGSYRAHWRNPKPKDPVNLRRDA